MKTSKLVAKKFVEKECSQANTVTNQSTKESPPLVPEQQFTGRANAGAPEDAAGVSECDEAELRHPLAD